MMIVCQYLVPVFIRMFLAISRDSSSGRSAFRSFLTHFAICSKFLQTCVVRNSGTGIGTPAFSGGTRTIGVISALHMMNSRMAFMQCSTNHFVVSDNVLFSLKLRECRKAYRREFDVSLAVGYQDSARCQ
jgi:hypothetical protein